MLQYFRQSCTNLLVSIRFHFETFICSTNYYSTVHVLLVDFPTIIATPPNIWCLRNVLSNETSKIFGTTNIILATITKRTFESVCHERIENGFPFSFLCLVVYSSPSTKSAHEKKVQALDLPTSCGNFSWKYNNSIRSLYGLHHLRALICGNGFFEEKKRYSLVLYTAKLNCLIIVERLSSSLSLSLFWGFLLGLALGHCLSWEIELICANALEIVHPRNRTLNYLSSLCCLHIVFLTSQNFSENRCLRDKASIFVFVCVHMPENLCISIGYASTAPQRWMKHTFKINISANCTEL